ncbi:MAG: hypothetical protein JXA77_08965 [Bacteroidales bacterium]|nr:hypothetical protein [Bacteroidales bacterium]MBN2819571.1 hypothetical protein [Bacteroidales bacterium]
MLLKKIIVSLVVICISTLAQTQEKYFSKIELVNDTSTYNSIKNKIEVNGIDKTWFYYNSEVETFEVRIYPKTKFEKFKILSSTDFELIDSIQDLKKFYRFKVKFRDLTESEMLRFSFDITTDSVTDIADIYLQPLTNTNAWIKPNDDQLFIGEEKTYEVNSNNTKNLNISNEWITTDNIDYRFTSENDKVFLHIIPKKLGLQPLTALLIANKPSLSEKGEIKYSIAPIEFTFNVKASRLQFLSMDNSELTLSEKTKLEGIEIQLESSNLLQLQKTYRVEAQEAPGGNLIAEIFTKQRLANNKTLCVLRPYNLHYNTSGYLYIKDGDLPQFITNVSITPETSISKISVLHEGGDWKESTTIYPGETFDLKIDGDGLHKADFHFEDLLNVTYDTLIKSEKEVFYKLKVPLDISKRKLTIYNYSNPTGHFFNVTEYQRPRELDFVFVNYGDFGRRISGVKEPILYDDVIRDLTLTFNASKIDDEDLFGKQYLTVKVQISGKNNELIEMKTIDNIVICPSGESPRGGHYSKKDNFSGDFSLNKYIRKPTYSLDEWSRINLVISHDKSKYGGEGFEKEVEIILKRNYSFNIDVSFPAGLLTIYPKDTTSGLGSLSGISMAMIAEFSFYHPDKINTYRPYKIGAGFLALNAFNLSEGMDLSMVVLGSVSPTTKSSKFSFPLYLGCGYLLSNKSDVKLPPADRFFFLFGPGIRVRF